MITDVIFNSCNAIEPIAIKSPFAAFIIKYAHSMFSFILFWYIIEY